MTWQPASGHPRPNFNAMDSIIKTWFCLEIRPVQPRFFGSKQTEECRLILKSIQSAWRLPKKFKKKPTLVTVSKPLKGHVAAVGGAGADGQAEVTFVLMEHDL